MVVERQAERAMVREHPLVSVIIACYNQGRFLDEAIQSCLRQRYPRTEIVVINDGSVDNTSAVAASYLDRLICRTQQNRGPAAARNAGLSVAKGDYVQFLDADDTLEEDKLLRHVEYLQSHPEVGIVYGDVRYFRTDDPGSREFGPYEGDPTLDWLPFCWNAPGTMLMKLAHRNILAVNCALVRRSVIHRVGPWNENLRALEDWEYWTRCAGIGVQFAYVKHPNALALVRVHTESMTNDQARVRNAYIEMRRGLGAAVTDKMFSEINFARGLCAIEFLPSAARPKSMFRLWRDHGGLCVRDKLRLHCHYVLRKSPPWAERMIPRRLMRRWYHYFDAPI